MKLVPDHRSVRPSKLETRSLLITHAGVLFGEKGYAATTGKEVCKRARVNAAALNYHFDGVAGLYAAVLDRVAAVYLSLDPLELTIAQAVEPREKLSLIVDAIVDLISDDAEVTWMGRVAARELIAPTQKGGLFQTGLERLGRLVRSVVADALSLPIEHTEVAVKSALLLGSMQWLLIADKATAAAMFPGLATGYHDKNVLREQFMSFAWAALSPTR